MLSYTSSGVRLFENRGNFITTALPVLKKYGTVLWQKHPYSDVMALRRRFPISCLNLSSGYYNWHCSNEFVSLGDVALAIEQGTSLLKALGELNYFCPVVNGDGELYDSHDPLIPIGLLRVPEP
jgi:hypothetical protein